MTVTLATLRLAQNRLLNALAVYEASPEDVNEAALRGAIDELQKTQMELWKSVGCEPVLDLLTAILVVVATHVAIPGPHVAPMLGRVAVAAEQAQRVLVELAKVEAQRVDN